MLDEVRVDDPRGDAGVLQVGVHALSVDAGALHGHELDLQLVQPRGQGAAVALEAAELPTVLVDPAVGLLDQHGDDVQHAVHIDAGHAAVRGGKSRDKNARPRLRSNGAGSSTVGGTSQLGGGPVRHRGRAFIRIATSSRLRAT
jgi:hypothetical protein